MHYFGRTLEIQYIFPVYGHDLSLNMYALYLAFFLTPLQTIIFKPPLIHLPVD